MVIVSISMFIKFKKMEYGNDPHNQCNLLGLIYSPLQISLYYQICISFFVTIRAASLI